MSSIGGADFFVLQLWTQVKFVAKDSLEYSSNPAWFDALRGSVGQFFTQRDTGLFASRGEYAIMPN